MSKHNNHGGRGGYRPNAGRKVGSKSRVTLLKEEASKAYTDAFLLDFERIIEAKKELALGDFYIEKWEKGFRKVYKVAPDNKAIEDILDRVVGKPKQTLTHEGEIDSPSTSDAISNMTKMIQTILTMPKK